MGLLDLDKVIIKKTTIGICCNACGGNLEIIKKRSNMGRFVTLFSFGRVKIKTYECRNCQKKYLLMT